MTLGDAINLLLHRTGVGVDVDRDRRHAAGLFFAIARRTAFGAALITSIKVRAAPDGRRVPSSHLRTVPTPGPMTAANSRPAELVAGFGWYAETRDEQSRRPSRRGYISALRCKPCRISSARLGFASFRFALFAIVPQISFTKAIEFVFVLCAKPGLSVLGVDRDKQDCEVFASCSALLSNSSARRR